MRIVEIFVPIIYKGKKTIYYISDAGRVMNIKTGRIMKTTINKGYERAHLYINNKSKNVQIHRLVAFAFIPNPENKPTVNHKDGNKIHNDVSNLEWATYSEQALHALKLKLRMPLCGSDNPSAILTEEIVDNISRLFEANELSIPEISNELCIKQSILRDILHRNTWSHITNKYDFTKYNKLGCEIYTDDQIHHVCELLEQNTLYIPEISMVTNVDEFCIRHILRKKSWTRISDNYNILKYNKIRKVSKNSEEQIHHVCKLLEQNKLSLDQIAKITGVKYKVVSSILNCKNWKNISSQYNIKYNTFKIKK